MSTKSFETPLQGQEDLQAKLNQNVVWTATLLTADLNIREMPITPEVTEGGTLSISPDVLQQMRQEIVAREE
jgi:hypothetical protein